MYSEIKNPWPKLIEAENYSLNDDFEIIKAFNEKEKKRKNRYEEENKLLKKDFEIKLDMIAEPFFGNQKADIIVLAQNPGIYQKKGKKKGEKNEYDLYKEKKCFIENIKKYHKTGDQSIDYPYYYFDPMYDGYRGNNWAKKRFRELKEELNLDWKVLSNQILYLQYFPYHSKNFKNIKEGEYLECQKYTFQLLANSMNTNALVICFRGLGLWDNALKHNISSDLSLKNYKNMIVLNSAQSVYVTKNNMKENDFEKLVEALKEKE